MIKNLFCITSNSCENQAVNDSERHTSVLLLSYEVV